jgi:hypothetical protein
VVQETLLTVHQARRTWDPARPFLPWLRAIAQRRARQQGAIGGGVAALRRPHPRGETLLGVHPLDPLGRGPEAACVPVIAAAARRQGLPPDEVDDVVQETLLTVHQATLLGVHPLDPLGRGPEPRHSRIAAVLAKAILAKASLAV